MDLLGRDLRRGAGLRHAYEVRDSVGDGQPFLRPAPHDLCGYETRGSLRLESATAIDTIEAVLARSLGKLEGDDDRDLLEEHLIYIDNNKDRMRYARLRERGLPVGSGVTESTAKNVINMRTKRSGQRWGVEGLRAVLNLRALLKSNRLEQIGLNAFTLSW